MARRFHRGPGPVELPGRDEVLDVAHPGGGHARAELDGPAQLPAGLLGAPGGLVEPPQHQVIGEVGRGLGERPASQGDAAVVIPPADRAQGRGDRQVRGRCAAIREDPGHPVEKSGLALLIEEPGEAAGQARVVVPQLDGTRVALDGLVGPAGELGELGEQDRASPPFRAEGGDLGGQRPGCIEVADRAPPRPVEEHRGAAEPPERTALPFDLAEPGREREGVGVVAGLHRQVEPSRQDPDVVGPQLRELPQVLPRLRRAAQAGLHRGQPVEEGLPIGSGDCRGSCREPRDRGDGLVAASESPVIQAGQFQLQARPQVFFGLVEDPHRIGVLALATGQPGEGEPIAEVARVPGLRRGQERSGLIRAVPGDEHRGLEQRQRPRGARAAPARPPAVAIPPRASRGDPRAGGWSSR